MSTCILEVKNASYSYEEDKYAIQDINLKINKGEKIAVIGNNGAGKSTFFLSLNAVIKLQSGDIYLHEKRVDYSRKSLIALRKSVGMVFQNPDDQIIASTVEKEISFGLFNLGMKQEEVAKRVNHMMKELNLTQFAKRPPHFLSGGEKKRITIADILIMEPEIILFDEPTSNLDYKNLCLFKEQLNGLHQKNVALLISTHDMNFVWEWADRIIVFHEGRIIANDTPHSVFANDDLLEQACIQKPLLFDRG